MAIPSKIQISLVVLLALGFLYWLAGDQARRMKLFAFLHLPFGQRLTAAQKWSLAASGNLAAPSGIGFEALGAPAPKGAIEEMLGRWWEVHDRAELLAALDSLAGGRHSEQFRPIHAHLSSLSPAARRAWIESLPPEDREGTRFVADHLSAFKNGRLIAWDQERLINLARAGFSVGWLDEATAWRHILPAAKRIQSEYGSWREMSDNYLAARTWWGGDDESAAEYRQAAERLAADPSGPWQTLAWNTPLDGPSIEPGR
jgi:hypothetical protein